MAEVAAAQRDGAESGGRTGDGAPLLPPLPPKSEYDIALRLTRDWPDGRGAWVAEDGGLAVVACVHEHVHCRVVSGGSDMFTPLRRLFAAARHLRGALSEKGLGFARSGELGSLVCNPDNLGTSFGFAARLRIPLLCVHQRFDGVLRKLGLECLTDTELRGATYFGLSRAAAAGGDHPRLSSAAANSSEGAGACWVQLVVRLGISESRAAAIFVSAVHTLIELEQLLQRGQQIEVSIGLE